MSRQRQRRRATLHCDIGEELGKSIWPSRQQQAIRQLRYQGEDIEICLTLTHSLSHVHPLLPQP